MPTAIRQQLTLFVNHHDALKIEAIREKFNPIQSALIASHVTLCREDEIAQISNLTEVLHNLNAAPITIDFETVIRFDQNKGVMLAAANKNAAFHHLRALLLTPFTQQIRQQLPHITFMHPRNSACTDDIFKEILSISLPTQIRFDCISLIQQIDHGKWTTLNSFQLK